MSTALYRLSSGEVVKVSLKNQSFIDRDTNYWGVLVDPSLPDGNACVDPLGQWRVFGYAKIFEAPNTVRNATQVEIDTFEPAQLDDESQEDADEAKNLFNTHPRFRKLLVAYSDILKDEFNLLRSWITDFKAAVDAAGNLGQLQSSVAALPDLPDRDLAQLKTAILNRITKDD